MAILKSCSSSSSGGGDPSVGSLWILAGFCLLALLGPSLHLQAECATDPKLQLRLEEKLGHQCRRLPQTKKISELQELIVNLKQVLSGKEDEKLDSKPNQHLLHQVNFLAHSKTLRFFGQDPSAPCLEQASAIFDLGELVQEREHVCSSEHLDAIENYYKRYLKAYYYASSNGGGGEQGASLKSTAVSPVTLRFFQLYASQVSFMCKSNLLHSLHAVGEHQFVTPADYDRVMPWLSLANTGACEQVESFLEAQLTDAKQETQATSFSHDDLTQCNARKVLTELSNINELVEVLDSGENLVKFTGDNGSGADESQQGEEHKSPAPPSGLFLIVPDKQKQVVGEMLSTCAKLRPIYEQTVLPIVRLARLGFNPSHPNFDKVCSSDGLMKKWFGLTLVCNSMLSSKLPSDLDKYKTLIEENDLGEKSFVVVDTLEAGAGERSSGAKLLSREDDDARMIDSRSLSSLFKNPPLDDELWIYKYGTTKLQRIKNSIMKKVFRLFRVDDIKSHIVFRQKVTDASRWIVRVVLITLALVTFGQLA